MPNWHDELRAVLTAEQCSNGPCCERCDSDPMTYIPLGTVLDVLDRFAAEHSGLVDLSLCGPQCPACGDVDEDGWTWCMVEQHAVYVGGPCPVLAARKETT